ncbi:MAG TPA: hypothetical protein VFX22_05345 [Candidatus Kapabacteria bacterium]|nr:hypothetical protein [Candidatus Kapabacteria bacterium]
MTKRQFVVLAFRLFALYFAFSLITNLGYFFQMLQLQSEFVGGALTAAFGVAILLFALSLLWRKSEWLMQRVFAIPLLSDDVLLVGAKPFQEEQVEGVIRACTGRYTGSNRNAGLL